MDEDKPVVKVTPIVIEGFEINAPNVTFQRLQEFALTMFERLLIQRKERSFLLLDRDKMLNMLTNLRREVREEELMTMNREAELERAQERFRQDTLEVEQEVKYLDYDHKLTLEQLRTWESSLLAKASEENQTELLALLEEKRKLKEELAEVEIKFQEQLMSLKKQQAQDIDDLKQKNEELYIQKEMEYKRGLIEMKEEMTLRHEMEMSELEERKNCHLIELRNIHKDRLSELKNFFNSVTAENLAVISCMKQSFDAISKAKFTMADETELLKKTNKKLQVPLEKSKAEVKNLSRQLNNYEKDLLSLKNNKRMLKDTVSEIGKIKKEGLEAMKLLEMGTVSDAGELSEASYVESMLQFRNYAAARRKQLEDLIQKMLIELKNKRKILEKLTEDPNVSQAMCEINFKFWEPTRLNIELEAAKSAYDSALSTLEEKLEEFCVLESTLGDRPWKARSEYTAPVGFISKQ